jgi:ubiquinone/menaquinone biosynthesis C-methylase UbiE
MDIQQAYADWAATYDSDRNVTRDLDQIVTRSGLDGQHCRTILELGCGTGKNTTLLAELGERVIALDFTGNMIRQAQARLAGRPHVLFALADLTQPWPCVDGAVDLATCNLVLEHISGLPFVFSEAHRVLAPAGRFFVCELHPYRQYAGKRATFAHAGGQTEIPAFVHHVSDFLASAAAAGLVLTQLQEWWHDVDQGSPPRLISFMFQKPALLG